MTVFSFFTGPFCTFLWEFFILPCVVAGGILFSVQTRGMHIFRFGSIMRSTVSSFFSKREGGKVTPFQGLCIALAGTVGTGSVVGTCQALAFGGPGALFWMWVAAFFGMIIKFFEVTLALLYRHQNKKGDRFGGPMYYMTDGIKRGGKALGVLFALFSVPASLGMGCLAQANSVGEGVKNAVSVVFPLSENGERALLWTLALFVGIFLGFALIGGAERIGKVASFLVPFMGLLYVAVTLSVILFSFEKVLPTLRLIVKSAFSRKSFFGASAGIGMKQALLWGLKRSAFSNEAGLGSAAIAHASVSENEPVRQGFFGIFEVFFDTMVICSLTGFAILVTLGESGAFSVSPLGSKAIIDAVALFFGSHFARVFIGLSLALFAFSTLLGWSLYGARSVSFLFGRRAEKPYLFLFCGFSVLGIFLSMEPIWALSDLFNSLMAIPNFIALFLLSPKVKEASALYFAKKKKRSGKSI